MIITKQNIDAMRELAHAILAECNTIEAPVVAASDWPMTVKDLPNPDIFFYLSGLDIGNSDTANGNMKNLYAARSDAKSALAFAQLSRLIRHINGGWWPDFSDNSYQKYRVDFNGFDGVLGKDQMSELINIPRCLYFKNKEDRNRSMIDHRELWETYFQKDVTK